MPRLTIQADGDVELWVGTALSSDPEDERTRITEDDVQIFATGPKYMCVSIKNNWIALHVVVAHAPHTWGTKAEPAAIAHKKFWAHLRRSLTRRHTETPVLSERHLPPSDTPNPVLHNL